MHQHLQLTPWQMQTLLPTQDGTVFISGDPHQNILLCQRGWRQRRHKEAKERMKSRQHYIFTISPSGNSTSLELVALLHDCFPPFTKELLCPGRGSRTFVAMRTLLRCTLATEPPISTIQYKHTMDSSLVSLFTTCQKPCTCGRSVFKIQKHCGSASLCGIHAVRKNFNQLQLHTQFNEVVYRVGIEQKPCTQL